MAFAGNFASGAFSSWRTTTSGCASSSHPSRTSSRPFTPLTLLPSARNAFWTESIVAGLLPVKLPTAIAPRNVWAVAFPFDRGYDLHHTLVKYHRFGVHHASPSHWDYNQDGCDWSKVPVSSEYDRRFLYQTDTKRRHQDSEHP